MENKTKNLDFIVLLAVTVLISVLLGWIVGYNKGKASCPECFQIATDTTISIDSTITGGTAERPDADSLIKADSVSFPVHKPSYLHGDTVYLPGDTVYVWMQYEHRLYEIPGQLKVWYSGIDPCIDSTMVYDRTKTITNYVLQTDYKMPRLTLDLGAGALYCDKGINPYLLGELRYNAKKTTFAAFGAIDHTGRWGAGINITYRINMIK